MNFLEFPQLYPHEYGLEVLINQKPKKYKESFLDQLHEKPQKGNYVERLTRHLKKGFPQKALKSYRPLSAGRPRMTLASI